MGSRERTKQAVRDYYTDARDGYWYDLGGRCHYGYTPDYHRGQFDLREAQIEMQRMLGNTLNLPSGSQVLDAGCGWSPVARLLTEELGYEVTGVDLIRERLSEGRQINIASGLPEINLANADYHRLPFENGIFDGLYTMETAVHADPLEDLLGEFKRVLKPGGRIVLFEYSIPDLNTVPEPVRHLAHRVIDNTGMKSLPQMIHGKWPEILERAGFVEASAKDISENVYASWYHLWKLSFRKIFNEAKRGNIGLDHVPGSTYIWPARKKLGYNICVATKPSHPASDE